jgi:hypothetical protein
VPKGRRGVNGSSGFRVCRVAGFFGSRGGEVVTTGYIGTGILRFVSALFFRCLLFSTTWPTLFLALFFQPSNVFNNFSALFFGLLRFVFWPRSFVISSFSALFLKKGILFIFLPS